MKIAALTLQYSPLSESFVRRELEGLQQRGHDVVAFTKRDPDGPLCVASSVEARPWTDANLAAFKPDVLYASLGFPAHLRTMEAARSLRTPYVLRCWQGYDMFTDPRPGFYAAAVVDPRCRAIVVEDAFAARYAAVEMRADGPKVRVVPNGVDTDLFVPATERGGPTVEAHGTDHRPVRVLVISRWVQKKGLAHLCAAWRALRPRNAELVIIGYGPEEDRLRAAAGLNTGVEFLPPIPPEQLVAEYQDADIFAAPCIAVKGGDADGIPTTVLEAMACGLPILGSDLHSMPLYVEPDVSGLLTKPGDEHDIASALDRLISDPNLRHRLGAQARRAAVERFSLSASLDSLEAILDG